MQQILDLYIRMVSITNMTWTYNIGLLASLYISSHDEQNQSTSSSYLDNLHHNLIVRYFILHWCTAQTGKLDLHTN